nr:hypothetical protein [uncultured Albidiferax sp.]
MLGATSSDIKRLARSGPVNLLIAALTDRSLAAGVNTPVGIDRRLTPAKRLFPLKNYREIGASLDRE